jgi:capsid protein
MMIHGYAPEYAGQGRGYSRIGHAVQDMQGITSFTLSQIMKAVYQSQIFMFLSSSKVDGSNPLLNWTNFPKGPFGQQFGSQPQPAPDAQNVTDEGISPIEAHGPPHVDIHEPGGMAIWGLRAGQEIKPFMNTAPAVDFDKFVDANAAYLSASSGMPLENLLMRFNRNYTASRGAFIMLWRGAKIWRYEMEMDALNPARAMWTAEEVAAGRIAAPGWSDPILRAAWLNGVWHGEPLPNIDEVKTSKADMLDVQMGAKTLDTVARERNGSDGARNRAKLAREYEELPESPFGNKANQVK